MSSRAEALRDREEQNCQSNLRLKNVPRQSYNFLETLPIEFGRVEYHDLPSYY